MLPSARVRSSAVPLADNLTFTLGAARLGFWERPVKSCGTPRLGRETDIGGISSPHLSWSNR